MSGGGRSSSPQPNPEKGDEKSSESAPAPAEVSLERQTTAAEVIQRNYRGYRDRRQLNGLGLDASSRWYEAVKEAQYRNTTGPTSRHQREASGHYGNASETARSNWKRVGAVARRAGSDDTSETDGEPGMSEEQLDEYGKKRFHAKKEREKKAKMMDLAYFLEMVDTKHRYGSHLRAYHAEWKKADTHENFFYWLDRGEGRNVELPNVSREKLEADQVRYLSREERQKYLIKIDEEGRLCWARDGMRISTNMEWKDSVDGIVPNKDATSLSWSHGKKAGSIYSDDDASSMSAASAAEEAQHYVNAELKQAKGLRKLQKVNASVIFNHLLQKTVKPGTWIFVADTSFRLYVGIKQSGAFQHSSFLHGARISAAGLIKIKDGQLRRLSPLSGHYRPPTENFRAFVHSLKDAGVDMSRVSISRSYAVLIGLEAYQNTRKTMKDGKEHMSDQMEKLLNPEEAKKKEDAKRDKSKSAQREREYLEQQRTKEEELKSQLTLKDRLKQKLKFGAAKNK